MQTQATHRSIEAIVAAIQALDLDPIKLKLMDKEEGQGWSREYADQMEADYKRFLTLLVKYPEETIAPNRDIDKFWHGHILDTMKYADDCENVFGYFLHHFPYFGLRGEEDAANLVEAGTVMERLYRSEFGEAMATAGKTNCGAAVGETTCGAAVGKTTCGAAVGKTTCGAAVAKTTCGAAVGKTTCGAAVTKTTCGAAVAKTTCGAAVTKTTCGAAVAKTTCGAAVAKTTCGAAVGKPTLRAVAGKTTCGAAVGKTTCGAAVDKTTCGAAVAGPVHSDKMKTHLRPKLAAAA